MPPRPARHHYQHHRVSAVLVVHDGARWLPEVLAALAAQTRPVQRLVAVDVGSEDGSAALLDAALGADRVVRVDGRCAFGEAVAAGVAHLDELAASVTERPSPRRRTGDEGPRPDPVGWLWLIHDDSAPDPDALAELVEAAAEDTSIGIVGPKVRDWDDPRLLVEVGLTMDRAGRRETGLERREYDQGQHDDRRAVLAVGTAGMLVRRDVWDTLGGLDPRLPMLRDDLDLGWRANAAGYRVLVVPAALFRHSRAVWTGRRPLAFTTARVTGVDRRHALLVVLANLTGLAMLGALPRLLVGALLRTVGFVLTRQVTAARDEIAAVGWTLTHTGDLRRMRAERRRTRKATAADLRPLFVGRTARLRGYLDAFADWITGGAGDGVASALDAAPDGEVDDLVPPRGRGVRMLQARSGATLVVGLSLLALVAARSLIGSGRLVGGDLLPVAGSARDLWAAYAASWHAVGAGTDAALSPSVALLAGLATLLRGDASLAVAVLLLGAVPAAGWSAYVASRRLTASRPLRVWAAATYALLPVVTGSVARGRLDVVVATIAVPPLVAGGHRLLSGDPRHIGWRLPFGFGLGLAAAASFAPSLWLIAALGLLLGALAVVVAATPAGRASALRRLVSAAFALGTALLLLLPWTWELVASPSRLVAGPPGVSGEPAFVPTALDLLLGRAGGPALPPTWAMAGLLAGAAAGLVRQHGQRAALAAWALVIGSTSYALLLARGVGPLARTFPGPALAVAGCGLVIAAVVAADGALERLGGYDFGWRQVLAGLVAAAAAVTPLVTAATWVRRGADEPLRRQEVTALPSVVLAEGDRNPGMRVLWLDALPDGRLRYALTPAGGLTLPQSGLVEGGRVRRILDQVVADLTSARGTNAAEALAAFNVRYVAVANPVPPVVAAGLDVQAGLSRVSFVAPVQLWQTLTPTGRVTVLSPALAQAAEAGRVAGRDQLRLAPPTPLPSRRESARAQLLPGPPGRLLVLAERADGDWVATLDGERLRSTTAYGWAQAFELPAGAGRIEVARDTSARRSALTVQALVLLVVLVLAAPSIRRRDDDPDEPLAGAATDADVLDLAPEPVAVGPSNVRRVQ